MYVIKDYLTDETVAYCSRREDALAMIRDDLDDRKLIVEKMKKSEKTG